MAEYRLNPAEIQEAFGAVYEYGNKPIVEKLQALAKYILNGPEHNLQQQLVEACKEAERVYNDTCFNSLKELKESFEATYDIAEWLDKRAQLSGISTKDAGFATQKVDAGSVIA